MYRSLPPVPGAVPPLGGTRGKPWSGANRGPMKPPMAPSPFHMSGSFSPVPPQASAGGQIAGGGDAGSLQALASQRAQLANQQMLNVHRSRDAQLANQQMSGGAAPMQMRPAPSPRNVQNAALFMQKLAMQKRDLAASRGRFIG